MRDVFDLPRVAEFDRLLALDGELRADVTGELVSRILVGELCRRNPDLRANGASDYPDVYRSSAGYDFLPPFRRPRRGDAAVVVYGAALKGREGRPVRVPDGLEVKTCRRTIKVDCHHPHPGLHLILVFDRRGTEYAVTDLAVSFLRTADYQEAARNTTATTVKYSFTGRSFVSLLGN